MGSETITRICSTIGIEFDRENNDHVALYTLLNKIYTEACAARDTV